VTLAAGAEARAALADGSGRLRSLLEGIGHTTGQVVIRDLAGVTVASGTGGAGTGQPGQPGSQSPTGQSTGDPSGRPGEGRGTGQEPSGSRGPRSAGDASSVHTRSHDATRPRDAGVDVTI
jgi:hypothetical protein